MKDEEKEQPEEPIEEQPEEKESIFDYGFPTKSEFSNENKEEDVNYHSTLEKVLSEKITSEAERQQIYNLIDDTMITKIRKFKDVFYDYKFRNFLN